MNREFILSGLGDSSKYIKKEESALRPNEMKASHLDPTKAKINLKWSSRVSLEEMILKLLKEDLY